MFPWCLVWFLVVVFVGGIIYFCSTLGFCYWFGVVLFSGLASWVFVYFGGMVVVF